MQLGWVDFSTRERDQALEALKLLREPWALDELGIAPIRDGFGDRFFPGISTLMTRAKYFFLVPYAIKDLEQKKIQSPKTFQEELRAVERKCAQTLRDRYKDNPEVRGIIGGDSLNQPKWVRQTPSQNYWSGLRTFRIFRNPATNPYMSRAEYIMAFCSQTEKNQKMRSQLYRGSNKEAEGLFDDRFAGEAGFIEYWNIPAWHSGWNKDLKIDLTEEEGAFLQKQIVDSCPHSLLGFLIESPEAREAVPTCESFRDLLALSLSEDLKEPVSLAASFADFLYVLRTRFNCLVSGENNPEAKSEWKRLREELPEQANKAKLDSVAACLWPKTAPPVPLMAFLKEARDCMAREDVQGLDQCIRTREKKLKGNRAKTAHPERYGSNTWYGGKYLDYRFGTAKRILVDIWEAKD